MEPSTSQTSAATSAQTASSTQNGAVAAPQREFAIPQTVIDKYPDLVELIKKTESMTDDEREYWFQILPIMTVEQVERLKKILADEAAQLSKLDTQYQDELGKLNKKHLDEWTEFERKQDRVALQQAEAASKSDEEKAQEELLKQLDDAAL